MTRAYDEWLGRLFEHLSAGWIALIMLAVAAIGGVLWYTFPAWVPRRFPRIRFSMRWLKNLRRPHWKWPELKWPWFKRKPKKKKEPKAAKPEPVEIPGPDPEPVQQPVPAAYLSLADRLAMEGRYAEAIRERLRESVTALTRYGVIAPAPAWTAHEVSSAAGTNRPSVQSPLAGATDIFSQVWYGRRPAGPDQDEQMRRLTAEVKAALEARR